jgi:hypothetical protein
MSAIRLALVLILIGADASIGFSQILRPRLRLEKTLDTLMPKIAEEVVGKLAREGVKKALENMFEEIGPFMDLESSIQLFAQIQMDPTIREKLDKDALSTNGWIETTTPGVWGYWMDERCTALLRPDGTVYAVDERNMPTNRRIEPPAPWPGAKAKALMLKELMTKGSAKVFLSETARFAEKLTNEKFSTPVLEKIHLESESEKGPRSIATEKEGQTSSRQIFLSDLSLERKELTKEQRVRSVSYFESHKQRDPKDKVPLTVHCSFVFVTQKENKEFRKTLSFDVYLEDLKKEEGTTLGYPWKVKAVQYK